MSQTPLDQHLSEGEIAACVDGVIDDKHPRIQAHLSACADCRAEVAEVKHILQTLPYVPGTRRRVWIPAAIAAAAAVVLLVSWPPPPFQPVGPEHREEAVTMTMAPLPLAPLAAVDSAAVLVWTSVPYADRYRVRLFDSDGTVIWQSETEDTVARLPAAAVLEAQRTHYWKVEAHTGFDRWAASDLVEFVPRRGRRP